MINSAWMGMNDTSNKTNVDDILKTMFNEHSENNDSETYIEEKLLKALELIKESTGLIEFEGATDAYWKDLETVDVKVMILSIPANTFIRSANDLKQELSAEDINGNFLILDGLAYKSNINTKSIVYMKV